MSVSEPCVSPAAAQSNSNQSAAAEWRRIKMAEPEAEIAPNPIFEGKTKIHENGDLSN